MLFKINYNVPSGTLEAAPDWQKLKIAEGELVEWFLHMPEEAADVMQLKVEYHGVQILPFSRGTWIYGIFEPTVIKESLKIDVPPYELDIFAFNVDDSYSHEYNLYVNIIPFKPVAPREVNQEVIQSFNQLFEGGP